VGRRWEDLGAKKAEKIKTGEVHREQGSRVRGRGEGGFSILVIKVS
jgi:hypothetical protein